MSLRFSDRFEWQMKGIEIPIRPVEADVLNQYISGMERVRGNRSVQGESVNGRTTHMLGIDLKDEYVLIDYNRDCCLPDDISDILKGIINEIDRRYIMRVMELKETKYPAQNIGSDVNQLTWTYGSLSRWHSRRSVIEKTPMVSDHIKVQCSVYDRAEYIHDMPYRLRYTDYSDSIERDPGANHRPTLWQRLFSKLGIW